MVTCKVDAVPKMNRPRKASSTSSGFRLLDGDQLDNISSISRNSIYKLKIDAMFDDSRSVVSQRLDDHRGSRRTGSIIMYGKNELAAKRNAAQESGRILSDSNSTPVQQDDRKISNSVQAQIERMFTDVAKDATSCSFSVRCLGSLALKEKVTSLQGLQDPLRQLYLSGAGQGNQRTGNLDICANGLRVQINTEREPNITPFHNIAVWSAVKFVVSPAEGGAAFLPLITDPENLDKTTLFRPLTAADQRRLSSGLHAPIFAVVMRSSGIPKILECHGFVCQTPEDAIVIAATLYQSLMAHVSTNTNHTSKRRTPRNQNGVSCISIASSSALTKSNYMAKSSNVPVGRKNSFRNLPKIPAAPVRPIRKKRIATSSLSGESDTVREVTETTTEERKKKSHKTKRAPPIPVEKPSNRSNNSSELFNTSMSFLEKQSHARTSSVPAEPLYHANDGSTGDILTKVAIPRSGSFLNTGGLSRYKSRATRRNSGKSGGGGGSPLGFSELFNEFRLNENLHSLDDILNAIIDADGMSFNDLKPIYKEFLLKLAVTLTKDELYQRSKNIMRRQKKRKLKRRNSVTQKKHRSLILGAKGLKKVFWFGQFRSCKSSKTAKSIKCKQISTYQQQHLTTSNTPAKNHHHRNRTGTSGSDVSEARNENNTLSGPNRNSSSGYVSCSECSYDSEACTCASADRCYCSLGADHDRVNEKLSRNRARDSLVSCKTEDKCYYSMAGTNENSSETTWCDSDSCISTSKCYCKRNRNEQSTLTKRTRSGNEKLGVDYELFTVGGDGKSIKRHEALSVKKSVEVAAVFADVKLSQTTDIKSLNPGMDYIRRGTKQGKDSVSSNNRRKKPQKSSSTNDILAKLEAIDKASFRRNSVKDDGYYQSMRVVSASLEDSLGYFP